MMTSRTPGRQLMVLDDAETIAHQARRQAVIHRRRREALGQVGAVGAVLAVVAMVMGASPTTVGLVLVALAALLGAAYQRLLARQRQVRRRRSRAVAGPGIGTPRPKGGFSTTRHRHGAPVWIDARARDHQAA